MITELCLGTIAACALVCMCFQNRRALRAEKQLARARRRYAGTRLDSAAFYRAVAGGFGVMVERVTAHGATPVWGVDTSGMSATDRDYAVRCAEEVADKLNEKV